MGCDRLTDERLQADKIDVLYGEADAPTRAAVQAHLSACASCREELQGFSRLRDDLRVWQPPARPRAAVLRRAVIVPRWLAAAAALLIGVGLGVGGAGYVSLHRALAEQSARAAALEERQRETTKALRAALHRSPNGRGASSSVLTELDARLDERIRASELRQSERLDRRFAEWTSRTDAQRRVDLARVAEGLNYLDGRNAQQLAKTNELMSYVLASQPR